MSRALALRLVWRDLKASPQLLWIVAALAFGVAMLAAVGTVRDAVLDAFNRDAAVLLGGDVSLSSAGTPVSAAEKRRLVPPGARVADVVTVNTILRTEDNELTVAMKGVDGAYPLYGEVRLEPAMDVAAALANNGLIVAGGVLPRLGIALGDAVRVGDADFTLRAVLVAEPDRTSGAFQLGPRVIADLGALGASGILREGSVARYQTRLALPPEVAADAFAHALRRDHPDARFQVRTASAAQPGLERLVGRVATFLTLASLAALTTGGLGIALAARTHLATKLPAMATLRALGGAPGWVTGLYALQLGLLGVFGIAIGLVLGAALPLLVGLLPAGFLPVSIDTTPSVRALGVAAVIGALVLACFTWLPLARAREVSPASLFRGGADLASARPKPSDRLVVAGLGSALVGLVVVAADDARIALVVLASLVAGTAVLLLLVLGMQRLAGRLARVAPPRLRLPLRELARPGGETTPTVLALALGLALLALVGQTGRVIDHEIGARVPERAPTTVFLDIQPDMVAPFEATVAATDSAEILQLAPYLRARLVRIAGVPVDEVEIGEGAQWAVRRDRSITWSSASPAGERMVAGAWWPADYTGPLLVAIEDEAAEGFGVGVGDRLTFNVLGRLIEVEIAAIRPEIDWSRGRLDFYYTFSPGLLEQAPHSFIASLDVPLDDRPALLNALAARLPTITPLLIDEAIAATTDVLARIRAAVAAVAGLTLISGLVVLAASLVAVRTRQRHAAAILKALGARRGDLVRTFLVEHAGLGALAAAAALVLGVVGARLVAHFALQLPFVWAPLVVLGVVGLGLVLTTATGLLGIARLAAQPAQPLLRAG